MSDSINMFLQLGIVGAALSVIVEGIKAKFGPTSGATKAITITLAVVLGAGVYFTFGTPLWISIVGILGAASVFYAFLLK